jgi:chromosome partitioning protein parB / adenine-specific methyltransferase|nr:MAG TPA: adenine specific DNA methyltransferase [Caudoviricetes sp.]
MNDKKYDVQYMDIDSLIPYVNNPRKNDHAVDAVASSIINFGFKNPIVVDANNEIINGHTRLKAAKKLGLKEVPVIVADDLTEDQVRAFRLADNKVAELADWDEDMLSAELSFIDMDMESFGFDLDDHEEDDEVVEDEYNDELPEAPTAKLGDIYKLGRHRLMCGDSTSPEAIQALTGGELVDLYLTDPPYNVAYEGKTKDALTIQNDSMDNDSFRQFLRDAFAAADSVMKPGAVFYIWHADSEGYNFRGACSDNSWTFRQCLIWNKNQIVMGRQDYHWKHEPCLYGWKDGAGHLWASDRKQSTVLNFDKPQRNGEHPTMKPVALFDYQIKNNTKGGDLVLDSFGGSGTTLIACEQNGRRACLMELDPRYVDVIIRRWEELTGEKAEKIN